MSGDQSTQGIRPGLNGKPQLLLTTALTVSKAVIAIVVMLIMGLSILAGASVTWAAMRAGVAAFILGLLAWFVNWYLERISLEQVRDRWTQVIERRGQRTTEWKA